MEESGEHTIGRHVRMAHTTVKEEHQLAEYVARLEIAECARILAADPDGLQLLPTAGTSAGSVPTKAELRGGNQDLDGICALGRGG